jgi:hypothetical protein
MIINKIIQDLDNTTLAKMADEIVTFKEKTGIIPDDAEIRGLESIVRENLQHAHEDETLYITISIIEREILKRFINLINV